MSKLFAVTGQNLVHNAGKRSVDTEVILRQSQSNPRDSDRYATAVAWMNYLYESCSTCTPLGDAQARMVSCIHRHERYRTANKITDDDPLHTLGDDLGEIVRVVDRSEWRRLSDVEKCALSLFHKNLGDDMEIPFNQLPSCLNGWHAGLHFATELIEWTHKYERHVFQSSRPMTIRKGLYRLCFPGATGIRRETRVADAGRCDRSSYEEQPWVWPYFLCFVIFCR